MNATGPRSRVIVGVVAAVVVLAAASTAVIAALSGGFGGASSSPNGRCSAPSLRGTTVDVALMNMGGSMMGGGRMMGGSVSGMMRVRADRSQIRAGAVSFRVANVGGLVHELVVLPLPDGQRVGERQVGLDGTVDESGSAGEVSRSCGAGTGDGIDPGSLGWATLRLAPGNYELVCNLPGHYASGMYTELRLR